VYVSTICSLKQIGIWTFLLTEVMLSTYLIRNMAGKQKIRSRHSNLDPLLTRVFLWRIRIDHGIRKALAHNIHIYWWMAAGLCERSVQGSASKGLSSLHAEPRPPTASLSGALFPAHLRWPRARIHAGDGRGTEGAVIRKD